MAIATLEAAPCAICQTTGGRVSPKNGRVERWSLERFGRTGAGCYGCYHRLYSLTGGARRVVVVAPPLLEPEDPPIGPWELWERTARVRVVKRTKVARRLPPYLKTRELDRALPWDQCSTTGELDAVLPDGSSPAGGAEGGPS